MILLNPGLGVVSCPGYIHPDEMPLLAARESYDGDQVVKKVVLDKGDVKELDSK